MSAFGPKPTQVLQENAHTHTHTGQTCIPITYIPNTTWAEKKRLLHKPKSTQLIQNEERAEREGGGAAPPDKQEGSCRPADGRDQ